MATRVPRTFSFQGELLKIILKDPTPTPTTSSAEREGGGSDSGINMDNIDTATNRDPAAGAPEYFTHKSLLLSVAPELCNIDIGAGRGNAIELSEVDKPTLQAFLEWVYYQDYNSIPETERSSLAHTKLYVLAYRFKITALKDLSLSKISASFKDMGSVLADLNLTKHQAHAIVDAATYAYKNIPLRGGLTTSGTNDPNFNLAPATDDFIEPLLKFFAQYISWALERFKPHRLMELLPDHPEMLKVILNSCSYEPLPSPPWIIPELASEPKLNAPDSQDDILYRECMKCSYKGLMGIQCASCQKFSWDARSKAGLGVRESATHFAILQADSLSGTKFNFHFKCGLCKVSSLYDSKHHVFRHNTGSQYTAMKCIGFLRCPQCDAPGYLGHMKCLQEKGKVCRKCDEKFESRNKLYEHIRERKHDI